MKPLRALILAGGTGGHIFPALAVARDLQARGWQISWLGTKQGLEAEIVPKADIPIFYVSVAGLRGKGLWRKAFGLIRLIWSLLQTVGVFWRVRPHLAIGMGGYVSGPGGLMAWLFRVPLIIHEQNAIAGFTNRCLRRLARKVCEGFPGSFPGAQFTGNPVRHGLLAIAPPEERLKDRQGPVRLLVVGGSRGAQVLNEVVPRALRVLPRELQPDVWHQTGVKGFESTQASYDDSAKVTPFIDDMRGAYEWADLVLCRAGALTVAELAAVGLPSILVPFPHAVDNHQWANAQYLVKAGAAFCIKQSQFSAEHLAIVLVTLLADREKLKEMALQAYRVGEREAVKRVSDYCEEVVLG